MTLPKRKNPPIDRSLQEELIPTTPPIVVITKSTQKILDRRERLKVELKDTPFATEHELYHSMIGGGTERH